MDPKTHTHRDTSFIFTCEEEMGVFGARDIQFVNIGNLINPSLIFASFHSTKVQGMVNYSLLPIYKYLPKPERLPGY